MMYSVSLIIVLLAAALLSLGWRAYHNHLEITRLRRNGYRRIACRQYRRGCVDPDFLRGLAELFILVLLLVAVLAWLGAADPPGW